MTETVLPSLLRSLYLTQMVKDHEPLADQAGREGWTFSTYLRRLCENEISTRARRRTERFLRESHLPDTKTMANLDQARLPVKTQRQLPALLEGDFVERAENVLAFGLPGRGPLSV